MNARNRSRRHAARLAALVIAVAGTAAAQPCGPADLTGDGLVDFSDYLEFLNRYDAGDLSVDFTGDGLVDFSDYLEFLNLYEAGCTDILAAELAANPLARYPHAEFVQAYLDGAAVSIAADPSRLPGLAGLTTDVYITAPRAWSAGDVLTDVRGSPQPITWPGGPLTDNRFTLTGSASLPADAGEDLGVPYDLVIDADRSGTLTPGDVVDGPGPEAGFYKLRDLTTANTATPVTTVNLVSIPVGRTVAGFEDERWYYPADLASRGRLPIVFISHGNGHQYTWYDFLGQHLASYGMIVIAHENNTPQLIPTVSTTTLDHTNTVLALQATLGGGVLNGHIDASEIYWIGHSRGGEGVAYAWPRLDQGAYTPTGGHPRVFSSADVKYVQSIAPVNEQTSGAIQSGAVTADFMLLYGGADGDVCGCPGIIGAWSFGVYERARERRNSVYIQGADHNDFNCCGFDDFAGPAGTAVGRPGAQTIQKALTLASIKFYRDGSTPAGEVLWRQYESFRPGLTPATAVVDYEHKTRTPDKFVIDDYQTQTGTGISSSGGAVSSTVSALVEGVLFDPDSTYAWVASDPFNGMSRATSSRGVVFEHDAAAPSRHYTLDLVPAARDTTLYGFLSFRAAQITRHPLTTATLADQVFDVELEDGLGRTSRIRIDAYGGGIEEVYQRSAGWQDEFETIRIRLDDFIADGRALDLTDIARVRFLFGSAHGTAQGRLSFDDIELVK